MGGACSDMTGWAGWLDGSGARGGHRRVCLLQRGRCRLGLERGDLGGGLSLEGGELSLEGGELG